jgi:hypothetical protein
MILPIPDFLSWRDLIFNPYPNLFFDNLSARFLFVLWGWLPILRM